MTGFKTTEDFPKNEIEFDERFSYLKACYDYLFKINGLTTKSFATSDAYYGKELVGKIILYYTDQLIIDHIESKQKDFQAEIQNLTHVGSYES